MTHLNQPITASATPHGAHSTSARRWLRQATILFAVMTVLVAMSAVHAQTPPPEVPTAAPASGPGAEPPCKGTQRDFNFFFGCGKHYYDKVFGREGFHAVMGSVAPGGGLTGGVGYTASHVTPSFRFNFESSARMSIRKYSELDANLRITRTSGSHTQSSSIGDLKANIYGFMKDMPRLDFFGIGPNTREQDRAVFHYRESVAGADIAFPLRKSLSVGVAVEGLWPHLVRISNPTVTSVERVYTEASAPGLTSQPPFLHFAAFAKFHDSAEFEGRRWEYLFLYHVYKDVGDHRYSFRRFDLDLRNKLPLGDKAEVRIRGRASLSETHAGQRVPFYLMETLGGSNIRSDDTLRGFRDYRFRDRNYFLVQTELLRELTGVLDLIGFYDVGKVAPTASRLGAGRLRHTWGGGLVIVPRRFDNILLRFYVAFGSGEGSRTYFNGGLPGRSDRLIR